MQRTLNLEADGLHQQMTTLDFISFSHEQKAEATVGTGSPKPLSSSLNTRSAAH